MRHRPAAAPAPTTLPTRSIGLEIDTVGSYGRAVIHGVMEFCHRNPHWVVAVRPRMWSYDRDPEPEHWAVDGVVIQAYDQGVVDRVRAAGLPAVNVANMGPVAHRPPTVVPDDAAIGRMAADYLVSVGFTRFAMCGHDTFEYSVLRRAAFVARLAEAGFEAATYDAVTPDANARTVIPWLLALTKPVAVFCCNDAWAHMTLTAARRAGLKVPDEVAVLGVDDDELLNTVGAMPLGNPAPAITRLPPLFVVPRATTDVTFVNDAEVAAALTYIKANAARPMGVDDLLDHLSISRRSLERRFRSAIGRSVATEIRRAHVERAKQLLVNASLSVDEVAAASGFTSATLLGVVFRKAVGESPTAFRRRATFAKTAPPPLS